MDETAEQMQTRHRKEQRDLQARITSKKKNATKKTRKGVNDECAELERQLRERQAEELSRREGLADAGGEEVQESGEAGAETNGADGSSQAMREDSGAGDDLVGKLEDTHLESGGASDPASPQAAQPKKRNRQKERLARRQAEQEAAAVAAEAEATDMVDHRGIERARMLKEFEANSLTEKEIQPDGHCLFSAVADQLLSQGLALDASKPVATSSELSKAPPYKRVREVAADFMQSHPDDFAPFMEEPLATYVTRIRDTAEWGGQLELQALANAYGVEIRVVQDGTTEIVRPAQTASQAASGSKNNSLAPRILWLAYYRHGYGLGEHYNSLRSKTKSNDNPV